MDFNDYGIVDWFDVSKGFGVVKSVYNGEVFIHKNKGIIGDVLKGSFVFIQVVVKNIVNNRNEGKNTERWYGDRDSFCEKIYTDLYYEKVSLYDKGIKWLLIHSAESVVKKIINSELLNNSDFIGDIDNFSLLIKKLTYKFILNKIASKYYKNNIPNQDIVNLLKKLHIFSKKNASSDELYSEYDNNSKLISRFLFDIWLSKNSLEFDDNIKWLLLNGTEDILYEIIKYEQLLKNNDFTNEIRGREFRKKYRSSKIFDQTLFNTWLLKDNVEYDKDLAWLLKNRTDEYLSRLLEYKSLVSSNDFVLDLMNIKSSRHYQIIGQFLLDFCISKEMKDCKIEIEWIVNYGQIETFTKYLSISEYSYDTKVDFAKFLRKFTSYKYGMRDGEIELASNKLNIVADILFQIWESEKVMNANENVEWLVNNANNALLNRLIFCNKSNWLRDSLFVKYILDLEYNKYFSLDDSSANMILKEEFLFDVYTLNNDMLLGSVYEWLVEYSSLECFKKLLSIKLQYSPIILERIFLAFFPNNNVNYFDEIANKSSWSDSFIDTYISDRRTERVNAFRKIFVDELNLAKKQILKRKIIKKTVHTATDLASFAFCPASYAINQIYDIDIREQENVFIGTKEHEKQRLLGFSDRNMLITKRIQIKTRVFEPDFMRIMSAKCISQGHGGGSNTTIYYSSKKKIAGIPDYIFNDKEGNFAVEEKYTFKKYNDLTELYHSHKIQALAYLYGLSDFKFNEVYIIYWFIEKANPKDKEYTVYKYRLFKLIKTESNKREIVDVFNDVEGLQNGNQYKFSKNRINYNKCVKCNYFPYCKYKKGDISIIELPKEV